MWSDFHFIRPAALWLAPLASVLWWLWQRRSDALRGWRGQMDADLLAALVVGRKSKRPGPVHALLAGWLVMVIAVAGPTWRLEPSPFADDATPLMILLKADVSMDRPDPAPSWMERARLKISDLAEVRKGQPLGLIAYAGSAHLVLPPTRDTAAVAQMAAEISPAIMPVPGDRLDLAVTKAGEVLKDTGGTLIVFADAVDGDVKAAAAAVKATGLSVHFLAIHSPGASEADALRAAARELRASVEPLSVDDADVKTLARYAANAPVARAGAAGDRWQEAGWWLVPIIALSMLNTFRREEQKNHPPDVSKGSKAA